MGYKREVLKGILQGMKKILTTIIYCLFNEVLMAYSRPANDYSYLLGISDDFKEDHPVKLPENSTHAAIFFIVGVLAIALYAKNKKNRS